jgi:23S rRNA (pseudouridine1915-N3)-methyltransferase
MKITVLAVGKRQPAWIDDGWVHYSRRMPAEIALSLIEIKPESRTNGKSTAQWLDAEAQRINLALPPRACLIVLDERGESVQTRQLADYIDQWSARGDPVAIVIGGPDGLDISLKRKAHHCLRLSSLTLPHGLARVVLAEALYRAASLLKGHPYHRE